MDGEEDTDNYSYIGTSHGSNHVTSKNSNVCNCLRLAIPWQTIFIRLWHA